MPIRTWFALSLIAVLGCGHASRSAEGLVADRVREALLGGKQHVDHEAWNSLLIAFVHEGRVDYAGLAKHRTELDTYLERVATIDLGTLKPNHLKALLINAYNALTVRAILDHPSVASIRDIDGVWTRVEHRVGGFELTLDTIEHRLLRPFFHDPRIHFAVNCASRSCAPLAPWAYDGERLEEQLEERTRSFLRDPQQVRLDQTTLYVSRYFDWYGSDFTAAGWMPREGTIPQFIARYSDPQTAARIAKLRERLKLDFLDYDWTLNTTARAVSNKEQDREHR